VPPKLSADTRLESRFDGITEEVARPSIELVTEENVGFPDAAVDRFFQVTRIHGNIKASWSRSDFGKHECMPKKPKL